MGKTWRILLLHESIEKTERAQICFRIFQSQILDEEHAKQKIAVDIQAERFRLLISTGFQCNVTMGNQVIQKCVHEQDGTLTCKKAIQNYL